MKIRGVTAALVLFVLAVSPLVMQSAAAEDEPGIQGVWQLRAKQLVKPDGSTKDIEVRENLFIFTDTHYSMTWTVGKKALPAEPFKPTDEETLRRYKHVGANAGTYKLEGSTLTTHLTFAKTPHYAGGTGTFDFAMSGDNMTLDWKMLTSPDGVRSPGFAEGNRVIFTLARAK